MNGYKLTLAYEGTAYHGWQVQPNGISVQEVIENALEILLKNKTRIIGAGRTDAGVHALGQVAHFHTDIEIDLRKTLLSLNALIPHDIRVLKLEKVPLDFHSQYSVTSKIYRYHILLDPILDPFRRKIVWHFPHPFSRDILKEAIAHFIGTHDFTSFANEAHKGVAAHDAVRTISRIDIIEEVGGLALEFEADGFLYKMVRNIVGTLVECANHKRCPHEIPKILSAKDRRLAGVAAPPQGLFLVQVNY